jgi:hypothetical protein
MEEIKLDIDKELDLLTVHVSPEKIGRTRLEVVEIEYNILFHIDPETNELVMMQIYDFSIIKRKLLRHLTFLITKGALKAWLTTIIASFQANKPIKNKLAYNH